MRKTKKLISILLAAMMLVTMFSVTVQVNASTGQLCSYYATNPDNKVGVQKTITIDGNASDWSEDMLIAQGAAWDVANNWKGGHENCVLDTYALFAAWDNSNLYVGWQMVNTTDTWARSGDGPLSDGGRVLDVPLILALSVDPSSVSMSNKNTSGGSIWGQKMGVTFKQHVDHLLYMSGKPGLGEPSMFTAVDSQGNTNYTTGCKGFAKNGIEYKMAETNICSHIYGLNGSKSPKDVYDDNANWVDFKTFKGSAGTHNTSYDSFYEIKIPLSTLGIDANYLTNNGIGAMLVATRGESGLDCIPYDDTMIDNATGSYSSDPSTSKEKEDEDIITSAFARIGNMGGGSYVPTPTTAPATQPTTAPATQPTTSPVDTGTTLTVNSTSNLFGTKSYELGKNDTTVSVKYDLTSAMKLCNGQWTLNYDTSKLRLKSASTDMMPHTGGTINIGNGTVYGNFSEVSNPYDFSSGKTFVQAEFDVIGKGTAQVNLNVEELSVGYLSGGVLQYKNAIVNGVQQNLSGVPGFAGSSLRGTTSISNGKLDTAFVVNATSNFFPRAQQALNNEDKQVTVSYKFRSSMDLLNSQWTLTYDTSKLKLSTPLRSLMPNVSGFTATETTKGIIKGNFTNINLEDFTQELDFVQATFDIIGTGSANVDLDVQILGIGYPTKTNAAEAYIVDQGVIKDVTSIPGFASETYSTKTVINASTDGVMLGDVNLDGKITISDATLIQKYLANDKDTRFNAQQIVAADTTRDGQISIADATLIQKYIARIVDKF